MTHDVTIDKMMHLAPFVILVLVAFFGTIGNLLIIGAVCIHRPLRTFGNAFVVNLAVADLIVTAYIMPMGLGASRFEDKPYSDTVCKVNGFLVMCTLGVSTQTLMVIALERYIHVCQKKVYHKLFSRRLTGLYLLLIWCYTAVWTVQGYTGWSDFKYVSVVWVCMMDAEASLSFNVCILIIGVLLPVSIQIFSYVSIFCKVHQSSAALRRSSLSPGKGSQEYLTENKHINQAEQRFLVMLVTIVVVFIVCWAPTGLIMTLMGAGISSPLVLYPIAIWLSFSNSSMNSIIYGIMNKNFRKGYHQILRRVACLRNNLNSPGSYDSLGCCSAYCSNRTNTESKGPFGLDRAPKDPQEDTALSGNRGDVLCLSTITIASPSTERGSMTYEENSDEPLPETSL